VTMDTILRKLKIELKFRKFKKFLPESWQRKYRDCRNHVLSVGRVKYFCIGRNKTGTTSIKQAFLDLGFPVGNQRTAEMLCARYYFSGEFQPIIDYCRNARVFQDVPFSFPGTFKHLDKAYPDSKFILTVRDNAEQWYDSITRFHARKFGKDGRIPTVEDLKQEIYPGTGLRLPVRELYGTPAHDPYNKEMLTRHYNDYNASVRDYFKDRPDDLLVINLAEPDAYRKFLEFIGAKSESGGFPWENRS
jgi:hypothetical protein